MGALTRSYPLVAVDFITDEELGKLPRWARVAFAARCGRRVQALLRRFWENPHPQVLQAFDRAISAAEESAAQAGPSQGLDDACKAATTYAPAMAGIMAMRLPGSGPAQVPLSDIVKHAVATAAAEAAQAAQAAARGDDQACTQAACEAYGWAVNAARSVNVGGNIGGLDRVLRLDLRVLQQAASSRQISDCTPVGPFIFPLEKETRAFQRELPKLIEQSQGRFVLIHDDHVDGVWDTYDDALQAGYERYQLVPFLVKQVRAGEDLA
jgi:hypothetical protein